MNKDPRIQNLYYVNSNAAFVLFLFVAALVVFVFHRQGKIENELTHRVAIEEIKELEAQVQTANDYIIEALRKGVRNG